MRVLIAVKMLLVAALLVTAALAADLVIGGRWWDVGLLLVAVALLAGSYGAQHWARRQQIYGPGKGRHSGEQGRP